MSPPEELPRRKTLPHDVPPWVQAGSIFFVTVCCQERGINQLCQPEASVAVFESVRHRHERGDWYARLVLLMPDHLHALLAFPSDRGMKTAVRLWKGYVARYHGIRWQRDFFDHRIRSAASLDEKAHYIRQNPVRAGLVARQEEWAHVWEPV